MDNPRQCHLQKCKMLWKWKQRLGNKATYSKLKECFSFAGNQFLADQVDELLHNPCSQSPHSTLATFKQYLKDFYTRSIQPPSHIHEWPPHNNASINCPASARTQSKRLFCPRTGERSLLEGYLFSEYTVQKVSQDPFRGCGWLRKDHHQLARLSAMGRRKHVPRVRFDHSPLPG